MPTHTQLDPNTGRFKTVTLLLVAALCLLQSVAHAAVVSTASGYTDPVALYDDIDQPISADYVLGSTTPGTWAGSGTFGDAATISWSLMATGTSTGSEGGGHGATFTALADFMPAGYLTEIINAFGAWEAVTGLTFVQIADDGAAWNANTTSGDIRLGGATFDGAGGTLAHGYYPPANGNTAAGDIHFDTADTWKIGFGGGGFDIFQVAAHEIGHAIGLDHTAVPNSLMNPFYSEAVSGPQADDIAGAQVIYGEYNPAVPEPSSAILVLLGCALLYTKRRHLA